MRLAPLVCVMGVVGIQSACLSASRLTQLPITQIIVTRYTGSDASKPKAKMIDRVVLKRSGDAIYVGNRTYVKRIGRYHGVVDRRDFQRLANIFRQNSVRNGPDSYNKYDRPEYKGRQVGKTKYEIISGTRRKTIVEYEDSGTEPIKQAGHISYGLLWKIRWQKVSSSDAVSK